MPSPLRPRTAPIIPSRTALLIVDAQNGICARKGDADISFYDRMHQTVIPNLVLLRAAALPARRDALRACSPVRHALIRNRAR